MTEFERIESRIELIIQILEEMKKALHELMQEREHQLEKQK